MKTFFREYSLITAIILLAMIGYVQRGQHEKEWLAYASDLVRHRVVAVGGNEAAEETPAPDRFGRVGPPRRRFSFRLNRPPSRMREWNNPMVRLCYGRQERRTLPCLRPSHP